jgi:uncharacterized protein
MTKMDKSVQITLIIVGALIVLSLIGVYTFFQVFPTTGNTITVQGQSDIKVNPDLVTVYYNVETQGTTSKEATDANSIIVDNLITNLVKLGFNRSDIQTQGFNVYPNQIWQNNQYVNNGFKAVHSIILELPTAETDKIGDTIDAGVNAGATISYINFELSTSKQNEYKAQALKQAAEDAKIKAQAVADGSGKRLGKLVSISTNDFYYQPYRVFDMVTSSNAGEVKAAATNIQPSSQDVTASISAVYKLN